MHCMLFQRKQTEKSRQKIPVKRMVKFKSANDLMSMDLAEQMADDSDDSILAAPKQRARPRSRAELGPPRRISEKQSGHWSEYFYSKQGSRTTVSTCRNTSILDAFKSSRQQPSCNVATKNYSEVFYSQENYCYSSLPFGN
ncbi:PREDICTED: double-strand break repair protein MRE11A-like [Chinchilla lanigera]|uniref:double-strand break repair protein MRE11A-like n=1 Tax=Chinchilla lanigera TaxID=34839 RepID=UPI00069610B3|nr:PREDICTED: double-strand break repair protein MRE11A-like [Chinchilla lanigera]